MEASSAERTPLLENTNHKDERSTLPTRLHHHLTRPLSRRHGDLALLFCYTITGLLDSAAVQTWGSFVSMQTGNTIYLGSGLAHPSGSDRWLRALLSIVSFCIGSAFFSRFHRAFQGRRRWVVVCSYAMQLVLVLIAAVMVQANPKQNPDDPLSLWVGVPIALLAFQSAGQAVLSRVLEYGSLTSVVLTSIYCDLFSDARLFAGLTENGERNRRVAAPLLLLGGAVLGGVWERSEVGLRGALWTAVGLKAVVMVGWFVWKEEGREEEGDEG